MALTRTTELADRAYGKLSAGQKRQVQFALAVCGRPSLLFLDEPTVGLDVQARETLWTTIRAAARAGRVDRAHHALPRGGRSAGRAGWPCWPRAASSPSGTVDDIRGVVSRKRISCLSTLAADDVAAWAERHRRHPRGRAPADRHARRRRRRPAPARRRRARSATSRCSGPGSPRHSPRSPRRLRNDHDCPHVPALRAVCSAPMPHAAGVRRLSGGGVVRDRAAPQDAGLRACRS